MMSSIASNLYPTKEMSECFAKHRPNDGEYENCAMSTDDIGKNVKGVKK